MSEKYVAGVCNIGKRERMKRYALGAAGLGATFLILAFIVILRLPDIATLVLFLPLMAAFEGIYQGYLGFCAGFAMQGIYDVSEDGDKRKDVTSEEKRSKDMDMAKRIHAYSAGSSVLATIIIYGVALII